MLLREKGAVLTLLKEEPGVSETTSVGGERILHVFLVRRHSYCG